MRGRSTSTVCDGRRCRAVRAATRPSDSISLPRAIGRGNDERAGGKFEVATAYSTPPVPSLAAPGTLNAAVAASPARPSTDSRSVIRLSEPLCLTAHHRAGPTCIELAAGDHVSGNEGGRRVEDRLVLDRLHLDVVRHPHRPRAVVVGRAAPDRDRSASRAASSRAVRTADSDFTMYDPAGKSAFLDLDLDVGDDALRSPGAAAD